MPDLTADFQPNQIPTPENWSASNEKAVIVGLYGVPGSGKSYLLEQLKRELGEIKFSLYEGSRMIIAGGLDVFQRM